MKTTPCSFLACLFRATQAPSASRVHNEGIVKAWLKRARQDEKLAATILDTGGFACWATMVQIHLQVLGTNLMRLDERKKLHEICYDSHHHKGKHHKVHKHKDAKGNATAAGVVCNRQHNGLGNQMFQYVFSRLAAESLGEPSMDELLA